MKRKTRRYLRLYVLCMLSLVLTACMLLPDFIGQMNTGKYEPAAEDTPLPTASAGQPMPEQQTEPHTCGLHAMRSMYAAYGLDTGQFDLRFRLGRDQPAMRVDDQSTGTLHPDLYRVLVQDGFAFDVLDIDAEVASGILQNHLACQQLALAVVYRNTYHWVLIGPADSTGDLVVYDSLNTEPGRMSADALLDGALSITLIEPAESGQSVSTTDAHATGLAEMGRLYQRKE